MPGCPAVGIDDDLAASQTGVTVRTADDKVARRVRQETVRVAPELLWDRRFHHVLEQVVVQRALQVDAR